MVGEDVKNATTHRPKAILKKRWAVTTYNLNENVMSHDLMVDPTDKNMGVVNEENSNIAARVGNPFCGNLPEKVPGNAGNGERPA